MCPFLAHKAIVIVNMRQKLQKWGAQFGVEACEKLVGSTSRNTRGTVLESLGVLVGAGSISMRS